MTLSQQDIISGRARIQSPYLYIQAAGSDGTDHSAPGIHLRWDFLRTLGDNHLPKGSLANPGGPFGAAGGFNKPNDFVTVLRAPYDTTYPATIDLRSQEPNTILESGNTRSWRFNTTVYSLPEGEVVTVVLRFADVTAYDAIRSTVNPTTNTLDFIKAYTGVLEVEVLNNLAFAVTWVMEQPEAAPTGQLRVETVSAEENLVASEVYLSARKTFPITGKQNSVSSSRPIAEQVVQMDQEGLLAVQKLYGENMRYARFDYTQCFPVAIKVETYRHFIQGKNTRSQWTAIREDFALSLNDTEVFRRLQEASYPINRAWPKYVSANPTTGRFTVSVPNYIDRWITKDPGEEGLKDLVLQYLGLSRNPNNPTGIRVIHPERDSDDPFDQDTEEDYEFEAPPAPEEAGGVDEGATSIDSLSMIKLIASDYHVARMFGFGHIDGGGGEGEAKYMYLALYETRASLEPGQPASTVIHASMTLPTGRQDQRLPVNTVLKPLSFGLKSLNGSTRSITNAEGYIPNAAVRIINLHIEPAVLDTAVGSFYESTETFTTDDTTRPVCYGVRYKAADESDWRAPELSNDPEYQDDAGVNETVPLTIETSDYEEVDEAKVYVHTEEEEGRHQYAVYGINWFSRASGMSNIEETETTFSLADIATLLPPLNFAVQLVQQEDPPVLTTVNEQATLQSMITANPSGDHTFIRITFDWTHAHNIAHQWANKVQLFFRQNPVRVVRGEIKSITEISTDVVEIRTIGFSAYSSTEIQTFNARVVAGDEPRFKGSVFVSDQDQYIVDSVVQSNVPEEGSVFRIRKIVQGSAQDADNNDGFIITDDFISPAVGDRFFVTENLSEASNWTDVAPTTAQPLAKEISVVKFSEHQEQVTEYDGSITTLNIGGIYDTATVTELQDVDENGTPIPGSVTGIYEITFADFILADHPDTDIDWYRGVARIPLASSASEKKVLTVIDIGTQGNFLKILATDPEGAGAAETIQTGTGINVNFHPGYRVYLKAQAGVLTKATTLPAVGQRIKQTLMGGRSVDTTLGAVSSVSTASVLLAREIIVPVAPGQPTGAVFATRPDFYGKATYTFDTTVNTAGGRKPLALVFYRANERAVLDTLYMPATVRAIFAALEALSPEDAAFYFDRFRDLVKVTIAGDGKFKEYVPGGYRFPNPDNNNYIVPDPDPTHPAVRPFAQAPNPGTIVNAVRTAIEGAFFPLTEQPVLYSAIRSGRKTVNRKPVIRNNNGEYLLPTDPAYDPAPMAVVLPASNTVRFTDYTLDGSSKNIYFYFVRELNDLFQFSAPSPVLGPVRLINTFPPEAPGIKKVTTQVEDTVLQSNTAVRVELNAYLPAENIRKVQLYRATSMQDASSVRTMTLAADVPVDQGSTIILDEFADLDIVPYGDPLFYRVVALREILNEGEDTEYVPSQPSRTVMASVIDVVNPVVPVLTATIGVDTGTALENVTLTWNRTAYNGTYYLYKMTETGNWYRIYETSSNEETIAYTLPESLLKLDTEGRRIYHRFKVDVENSSGLLNLEEAPLTV
jgi:hypothetical protein